MYCEFFGLTEKPFSITPDLGFFYLGKQHEQALAMYKYGIEEKLGFMLLTGEVGSGKTVLTRALLTRLSNDIVTSLLFNPILDVAELLKAITNDFGIKCRYTSPQKQIEALNNFLLDLVSQGKIAVAVIDEAQNLSREALEMVRLLTNLETEKQKLLQVLLVGQPELNRILSKYDMRQVDQRITARFNLEPFSLTEMMRYINHRICIAGGGGKIFFEPQSYKKIYSATKGFPRLINLLCDRALMVAFVKESFVLDKTMIDQALKDWRGKGHDSVVRKIKSFFRRSRDVINS